MNKLTRLAQGFGIGRVVCLILLAALVALRIWDPPLFEAVRARSFRFLPDGSSREKPSCGPPSSSISTKKV